MFNALWSAAQINRSIVMTTKYVHCFPILHIMPLNLIQANLSIGLRFMISNHKL